MGGKPDRFGDRVGKPTRCVPNRYKEEKDQNQTASRNFSLNIYINNNLRSLAGSREATKPTVTVVSHAKCLRVTSDALKMPRNAA